MGHERLGLLPRTIHWRQLIELIADSQLSDAEVREIAERTLRNVRSRFGRIDEDQGIQSAFAFLVRFAASAAQVNFPVELARAGIRATHPTPPGIAAALRDWMRETSGSVEYSEIARGAATHAITEWYRAHYTGQEHLFEPSSRAETTWRTVGTGAGFCELARLFYANFTQRYLNYFLDREASAVITDIAERNAFSERIRQHVEDVSVHAFETARITQSFSAGWFNKHAREGQPGSRAVESFVSFGFKKMREELLRETRDD